MFYDIFFCLRSFYSFFLLFSGCFSGFAIVFYFLASFKGFLRIYAAPDIRTGSDRFVPSFPICFANDRLLPYRSDVSLLSFNCRGCFIPIPPCFFLNDALVFFRLCRLSVAFLSTFSSCLVRETSVRFSSVVRLIFALFPLRFICFGLSLSVYLFSNKKAHFCAFRLFYIVFQIAFAISLIPSLFRMACLSVSLTPVFLSPSV